MLKSKFINALHLCVWENRGDCFQDYHLITKYINTFLVTAIIKRQWGENYLLI